MAYFLTGAMLCLNSAPTASDNSTNIAGASRVTVNSWLERMNGDFLIDGNTAFVYRKTGWTSGTRFPVPQGIFREEPILFDFHRSEPAKITGVEIFSRSAICFAVDVYDGKQWKEVARNAQKPGYNQPTPPSRIDFAESDAFSVRVRLLGYACPPDTETSEHYLLGEVKIYGRLRGVDLSKGLQIQFGSADSRIINERAQVNAPLQINWISMPEGVTRQNFAGQVTLSRRFGSTPLKTLNLDDLSESNRQLSWGTLPPGAYTVRVTLWHKETGSVIAREETLVGVASEKWARGDIAPLAPPKEVNFPPLGLNAAGKPPLKFVRCADVNGLDDVRERLDQDYYFKEVRDAGAVADIFLPWSMIEPLPGIYDFDIVDGWFAAASKWGVRLRLNLNPPLSGYLPSWLEGHQIVEQYKDGTTRDVLMGSIYSPLLQTHARQLFDLLMKRYGKHPAAALWVLNVNGEYLWRIHADRYEDASPWAVKAFQQAMQKKYGTIENLNRSWNSNYKSFEAIQAPVRGRNPSWTNFCDFMLEGTTAFYEPIAARARELLGPDAILLMTAGHLTSEPFVNFAKKYNLWQSNHSQENPQFISWGALWRSHGIIPFGEPGFVNVELLDVNRTFFINAVCGVPVSTFRQYGWPNNTSWLAFKNQQLLGDKLVNATAMRLPVAWAGTFESGLLNGSNTFSVGGVWNPVGCYNDALLKMGAVTDFYDGHNPAVLEKAKVVVELGSTIFRASTVQALSEYVNKGGHLVLFPPLTGSDGRRDWEHPSQPGDVLFNYWKIESKFSPQFPYDSKTVEVSAVENKNWLSNMGTFSMNGQWKLPTTIHNATTLATTTDRKPAIIEWPQGSGVVTHLSGHLPDRRAYGNGRRNSGGTGWNISYNSPETEQFLKQLFLRDGITLPFQLSSDLSTIWACGFSDEGKRYILLYNSDETHTAQVRLDHFEPSYFPITSYNITIHSLRTELQSSTLSANQPLSSAITTSVGPYSLVLVEMIPHL